jgi:hypothetical protein
MMLQNVLNLVQLDEQVEYNEYDLEDKYYNDAKEYLGNKDLERGNLIGRWNHKM